jgi:hypothetical protein
VTASLSLTRRSFIAATASAMGGIASRLHAALPSADALNVRETGAVGDGIHDDTAAFAAALRRSLAIHVPAGTYLVGRIMIPAGRTISTDGFATRFRQRRRMPEASRLLNVIGSNVRIGDCSVDGNIASDRGEQFHGIFVNATEETGDISDVVIGNVRGANLRGDVVYVGGQDGLVARNVRVGAVHGENILRNVVSVVGGENIRIERVTGTHVGMTHLDIEPDAYNGPVIGCTVGEVIGGFVQVAGSSPYSQVEAVHIGTLDLSGPVPRCTPPYVQGLQRRDALTIRNYRDLRIARFVARGFGGQAIRQVWDPGALSDQDIHIREAEIARCATDHGAARAYIYGSRKATRLAIDDLTVDVPQVGVTVIQNCKHANVTRLHGKLPPAVRLIGQSEGWIERVADDARPAPAVFVAARTIAQG